MAHRQRRRYFTDTQVRDLLRRAARLDLDLEEGSPLEQLTIAELADLVARLEAE